MAGISASISWGSNPSSTSGLDSSLWGAMNTTSTGTNSAWGPSTGTNSLSLNQGHNVQVGASSIEDNQNSNGSASANGWGLSPVCQNGAALPGNLTQSQANSNIGSQGGSSVPSSQSIGSLGTGSVPWQNSKLFAIRDFAQKSDSAWNNPSSTAMSSNSTGSLSCKETVSNIASSLSEPNKMDLAAGLVNLTIDKTAPPPDLNWSAMKGGWSNTMESSKLTVGTIGNPELSFAQATQKGQKTVVDPFKNAVLSPKEEEIRQAIESNEGWGTCPIRQDTTWDIDSVPKPSRKVSMESSEMASSMWNNNNGTAIWESSRETQAQRWGGGSTAGVNMFADKDPSSWNMPPKSSMDGSSWGGGGTIHPVSDKSMGNWGSESQQSSSKLWGSKTETGSWNEPPQERNNMTWGGQETDVGTWEDPSSTSRRIVSSSGVGPVNIGGGNNGMNIGSNMSVGNGNMGMGSSSMPIGNSSMGSSNMPPGGGSMGLASGSGMNSNMMMAMAGSGGGLPGNGMMGSSMNMGGGNNLVMGTGNNLNMSNSGMGIGNRGDSMFWNDPSSKPQGGWNPAGGPQRLKLDEPWNKAGIRPIGNNGWGEPANALSQKADDGTSIWAANAQEQARAAGWGEPSAVWNPAFGARPKLTTGWAGNDQDNWQRKLGQQRFTGNGGQPQMRVKLIQQLMDMGFKKEEAQNALISNNMNFESALEELHKKEMENDVCQGNGSKMHRQGFMSDNSGMVGDDIFENRSENHPHVPNFPMQNTPFNNSQVPNQPFMSGGIGMFDRSKAGPPMPPNNNGNMNNLQHKFKVLQQQAGGTGPAMKNLNPTQARGGTLPGTNTQTMVQQQAAQQQILQQLQLAVQSGLISPQLLNHQLPHNILVMLQQLLQLQNAMQTMMQRQQFLQQNKMTLNIPRPQLEHVSVMVGQYKSQIQVLQKQLQVAQQSLLMKQQPPSASTPTPQMQPMAQLPIGIPPPMASPLQGESSESMLLTGDINAVNPGMNNTSMSRLNQWKQPALERDSQVDVSKAPGSKLQQNLQYSHSTSTLGPFGDLPSLNISGDTTWSSTTTSDANNWPSVSGDFTSDDGKTDNSTALTSGLGGGGNLGLSDVIPEFVPGKPWQGLSSKSVEDDPHITPGSISRSLSVNVVKDDYLNHLTGNKSSPSFSTDSTWGKVGNSVDSPMVNAVSFGTSNIQTQQANSQVGSSGSWHGLEGYNHQNSWAGRSTGSAFTQVSGSGWENRPSSSWLKNISYQVEEQ